MVHDAVWNQAWSGRRKSWQGKVPGQQILCIGCLEKRIGRTLTRDDFTDAPANDAKKNNMSDRLRDRLTRSARGGPARIGATTMKTREQLEATK
jgi:hypothetical protein